MPSDKNTYLVVETFCTVCGEKSTLSVLEDEYDDWKSGTLIQKAIPSLNPNEREKLISGTCPECLDEMFKEIE